MVWRKDSAPSAGPFSGLALSEAVRLSRRMTKTPTDISAIGMPASRSEARKARLAAALKSNLHRRKVQARSRAADESDEADGVAAAHTGAAIVEDKRTG
jgi:hypothetical protein